MNHRSKALFVVLFAMGSVDASAQHQLGTECRYYQLHGHEILACFDIITGTPARTSHLNGVNIGEQTGLTYSTPETAVAAFETLISNHLDLFRFDPAVLSDPLVSSSGVDGDRWYVWYYQVYEGLPVFRSLVAVVIKMDGTITTLRAQVYSDISINTTPTVSLEDADVSVRAFVADPTSFVGSREFWGRASIDTSELIVSVDVNNEQYVYSLAWNLWFEDPEGAGGQAIVDAHTGEVYQAAGGPVIVNNESSVDSDIPDTIELFPAYPNPFRVETTFSYRLARAAEVKLSVVDLLGRTVDVVDEGLRPAGSHSKTFDASRLPSGTYLYRLQVGSAVTSRIMVVNR